MPKSLLSRKMVACLGMLAAGPALVFGQAALAPQGSEYAAVGAMVGDQTFPEAAINGNGGILVWQDNSISPLGLRINASLLDINLRPVGSPFVVSSAYKSKNTGDQIHPQVALLQTGGSIVVWQSGVTGGKNNFQQIYARIIGASGAHWKNDFLVGSHRKNNQVDPVVTTLSNGNIVVVWSSSGQDGDRQGIFAQVLSQAGKKLGKEFQINQFTPNNQRTPAVTSLAGGGFVVAWVSEMEQSASSVDVYARVFDPTANPLTSEFPVDTTSSNNCANPALAGAAEGGFAVAWSQNDNVSMVAGSTNGVYVAAGPAAASANGWDVLARTFDANAAPANDPFLVNTYTYGDQYAPKLSALGNNYLAIWTSLGQDGSWEGVYAQLFGSNGDFYGAETPVNTTTIGRQIQPAVATDGANRIMVNWSSLNAATSYNLVGQTYLLSQ